jgi:phospholipid/cholesterol/gamma-HCH transport system substrate-binding protein
VSLTYQQTRFRYANQAVGVFVILTVMVFVAAFLFSGQFREWSDPGEMIKIILPSDGLFGLSEGAEVEILGTKAGKVLRIVINPDQQIHADVQIQSDMKAFVRRDSSAVIRKRFGVAGDSFLDISRGFGEPLDWEFAVIDASVERAPTESFGEILDEARTKIFPIIEDTQQAIRIFLEVLQQLHDPEGDMHQLLGNLNAVSSRIARGEGAIGRLLTEEQIMDDLVALLNRFNTSMARFDPIFDDLETTIGNVAEISIKINEQSKSLPEINLKIKDLLVSVKALMKDLSRTTPQLPRILENVSDATDSVPVLMLQTQQVMVELERLIKQLQSNWLLRGSKTGAKRPTNARISPLEVRP